MEEEYISYMLQIQADLEKSDKRYYGTGRTRIWMGANLESFSIAHLGPTQQDILWFLVDCVGLNITITSQLIE